MTMRLPKAALSQYLRTRCDRMLACAICESDKSADTLLALPPRPGLAGFRARGLEFEHEFLHGLASLFPGQYVDVKALGGRQGSRDLTFKKELESKPRAQTIPWFFNEPSLDPQRYRQVLLQSLGLDAHHYPDLTEMRPDLVLVLDRSASKAELTSHEIRPDGSIRQIADDDTRIPLRVLDLKFAEKLNTAYAGEVCLYAMVLAAWLQHPDIQLADHFYVSAVPGVLIRQKDWNNRAHPDEGTTADRLAWLERQIEDAPADLYAPPVVRFLYQDVPRVLRSIGEWRKLEWQVTPSCAFCDYLGYPGWSKRGIAEVQKRSAADRPSQPAPQLDHYCYEDARKHQRVNQLPNFTRGMLRTLDEARVTSLRDLSSKTGDESLFSFHNGLKIEAARLPRKAGAVIASAATDHPSAISGQLARYSNLLVSIVCFFDAATGLLTSLGMSIDYRSPTEFERGPIKDGKPTWVPTRPTIEKKQQMMWVMEDTTIEREGEHLLDCLRFLSQFIEYIQSPHAAPADVTDKAAWAKYCAEKATVQVLFWDQRQDTAFREAVGRHLHLITHASDMSHALVWLFPPNEVVASDRMATTPAVVYLHDVVVRLKALPTTINDDILSVATQMAGFNDNTSPYMWDRVAGVIPKERSLEISQRVPPKTPPMSISQCIDQYRTTLRTLLHALRAVAFYIQREHASQLSAEAPNLAHLAPTRFNKVAADAMLWLTHHRVCEGVENLDHTLAYTAEPHELEARYQALRVNGLVTGAARDQTVAAWRAQGIAYLPPTLGSNHLLFRVRASSRYVKFRNDTGFMVLLPEEPVGAGNMTIHGVCRRLNHAPPDSSQHPAWNEHTNFVPLSKLLQASLVHFDRDQLVALVAMDTYTDAAEKLRILSSEGILDMHGAMVLMERAPQSDFAKIKEVAEGIGNPSIAVPAPETRSALVEIKRKPGRDALRPAGRVLWNADALILAPTDTSLSEFDNLLDKLLLKLSWPTGEEVQINESQKDAIKSVIARELMLVWGGPGTGKTQTLSCAVILEILLRLKSKRPRQRIYVTGPTYRAVTEVAARLLRFVNYLPAHVKSYLSGLLTVSFVASGTRPKAWADLLDDQHRYAGLATELYIGKDRYSNGQRALGGLNHLRDRLLSDNQKIELVFSITKQSYRIGKGGQTKDNADNDVVVELFDRIFIDESSQLSVAESLPTIGLLAQGGRLALFGDVLQMPPIQSVDPPAGAEHMVGSLHEYLTTRFAEVKREECFLRFNYRSCEPLVRYARMIGYDAKFESKVPDRKLKYTRQLAAPRTWPNTVPWSPLWDCVLDGDRPCVAVTYDDGIAGQANDFEATLVAGIVLAHRSSEKARLNDAFDEHHFWSDSIGIVTPHRAQRSAVVELLRKALTADAIPATLIDEAVDTVERFQGGERDVILVSFGIGDPDLISREEDFLFQRQRINVAISRARAKAVLLLSRDLLFHLPDDKAVVESSRAIKWFAYQLADQREAPIVISHGGVDRTVQVNYAGYTKAP